MVNNRWDWGIGFFFGKHLISWVLPRILFLNLLYLNIYFFQIRLGRYQLGEGDKGEPKGWVC